MAKLTNKLTTKLVEHIKESGFHADGNGLYLQVSKSGSKSWAFRYQLNGKPTWHGLGSVTKPNNLQAARMAAIECKQLLKEGIDPKVHKKRLIQKNHADSIPTPTFRQCAISYIESKRSGWKNAKHCAQWKNTLETYAYPVIGELPISTIDIDHVLSVLQPIWHDKTETASRVRQRMESILSWAKVKKYRHGENPALWRGNLDQILPQRNRVQKPKHHNALHYRELPAYFKQLRQTNSISARLLAFTILNVSRIGESRDATYSEIDFISNTWIVPASRMKAGKEHHVPLTTESLAIIEELTPARRAAHDFIFPGIQAGKPISASAPLKLLKRTHPDLTVHGFRSTFRDWCAEQTTYSREVAEAALAHRIKDKAEAAYQRGNLMEKRRALALEWEQYCFSVT
ncbi:DUF4102 domain-containing protein [Alteromonas sediminis]|uniref:DUF4102 domain-containing protein n=1 Tax=Alteromonas sediminis TaxID=2259342 RepID=A0A3N5Y2X2_9ALTE|nr:integrase arm-type DNA-binding domain-containing protein [Alteromonas sediminis]RPJ67423.1 DUF4102 domain-containing protein [Alteromonas sediminis]